MDSVSENKLAEEYLPLVFREAHYILEKLPHHADRDDVFSNGNLGLVKAIRGYDKSKGMAFGSYAKRRISGEIMDGLRKISTSSRHYERCAKEADESVASLSVKLGREPSDEQVAAEMGISTGRLEKIRNGSNQVAFISIDEPASAEIDFTIGEIIPDDNPTPDSRAGQSELVSIARKAIMSLSERRQKAMCMYYLEGLRLADVAECFGMTVPGASAMIKRGVEQARAKIQMENPLIFKHLNEF